MAEFRDPDRHKALCLWLTANDVDLNTVPVDTDLSIETGTDGRRVIHFEEFILTDDGHKQVDPEDSTQAWTRQATAPCHVEPPADLGID